MTGAALSHVFANDYGDYGFHIFLPLVYPRLASLPGRASENRRL